MNDTDLMNGMESYVTSEIGESLYVYIWATEKS